MKYLKRYNENYESKDTQSQIDEILDSLSKKGKLSESEKQFMDDASSGKVQEVSTPKPTGNMWADMANPHNIGIMWNDGNKWKRLKTLEEERKEKLEEVESSDEQWERERKENLLKHFKENPELEKELNELRDMYKKSDDLTTKIRKKYKDNSDLSRGLEVATKGNESSLIQHFGYYGYEDDEPYLYNKEQLEKELKDYYKKKLKK